MKESFVGLSGIINCPDYQGIEVRSIQADVSDPATNDVVITLSGINGTFYEFNAVSPVVCELHFEYSEDIHVSSAGTNLNTVVINYITYGEQARFMEMRSKHRDQPAIGRW